ncbi:MAG: hypothetical protein EHM21_09510 [Chloroflexi bacterium]|nr:MAG: hypothetical protein EHM21_09510 [Chloroflexota bacterium]
MAVSAHCQHPIEACNYGAWICSAEIQRSLYLENGGQPGNVVAWESSDANRLTHDFFFNLRKTLDAARIRPRQRGFTTFQEQAGKVIHAFLKEQGNIEQCLITLSDLYETSTAEAE